MVQCALTKGQESCNVTRAFFIRKSVVVIKEYTYLCNFIHFVLQDSRAAETSSGSSDDTSSDEDVAVFPTEQEIYGNDFDDSLLQEFLSTLNDSHK